MTALYSPDDSAGSSGQLIQQEGTSAREYWFQTPPKIGPNSPSAFGIIGKQKLIRVQVKQYDMLIQIFGLVNITPFIC